MTKYILAIILVLSYIAFYVIVLLNFQFGTPEEEHTLHPLADGMVQAYRKSEEEDYERDTVDWSYSEGESFYVVFEDDELVIVISVDGQTHIINFTLDTTAFRRHVKLYYGATIAMGDRWIIYEESTRDNYHQLDMNTDEFFEALEELTIEDYRYIVEWISG